MTIKKWNGTQWVDSTVNVWNGNRWNKVLTYKQWDGKQWVSKTTVPYTYTPVTQKLVNKTETKVFTATWSQSYDGNSNMRSTGSLMYQGKYGKYDTIKGIVHDPIYYGVQRSLFGFDIGRIQSEIAGATIKSVELYLYARHWWYVAGGTASVIAHNFSSKPAKFNYVSSVTSMKYSGRTQGRWITLPLSFGNDLKSGRVTGFGLFKSSEDPTFYGYFDGAGTSNAPQLRITFTKNYYESNSQPVRASAPVTSNPRYITYTVVSGDTLWAISQKYGVTVAQLQSWNGISGTLIKPNDKLKIYTDKRDGVILAQASSPKYTSVIKGEGLVQVTERLMRQGLLSSDFETARRTLMSLNGFTTSAPMLHPGDKIMYSRV